MKSGNQETGRLGEELAAAWLRRHGYRILARNHRCRRGEVDIVAQDRDMLVFVEVKTRTSLRYGTGFDAVDIRKQKRLIHGARDWLSRQHLVERPCRFDVIWVDLRQREHPEIKWIRNAFDASEEP